MVAKDNPGMLALEQISVRVQLGSQQCVHLLECACKCTTGLHANQIQDMPYSETCTLSLGLSLRHSEATPGNGYLP